MSQENVEQQYESADAFSRRDLDAFLAVCDPTSSWSRVTWSWMAAAISAGDAAVRRWWETLLASPPTSPLRSRRYAILET